ncbi:MAG: DNA polymerase III subunit alpha [candidate division Zixibacteria bacterium HGW-Zixibacteria-1]|nr:MAG: DNA polymerase III subunit alpha [candidate division Zixibacteria bacterium HGW-Zixibacteria-1]
MKFSNFVHLHTHSQYSLLDGACKIDPLIELAKKHRMPALAITDHGNLFGAAEFYKKATRAGIKPIIGTEAYVAAGSRFDKKPSGKYPDGGFHLVLLAKNRTGYKNLIKLSSAGFLEGFYHRPRIDKELLREHSEGLFALTACLKGEVNWNLLHSNVDAAVQAALELRDIFGEGNFFLEMQNHGLEKEEMLIPMINTIHRQTGIPLVATNDCHYLNREDWEAHDALLCIQTGKLVSDRERMRYNTDQIYFKSAEEMTELFTEFPEALENTIKIAEACNLEMEMGHLHLPHFPIPEPHKDADEYVRYLAEQGLTERYKKTTDELKKRLDYELGIINQMGFAGYFLIVKDFIDYARTVNVPVGPGRGSAAGSLVSYCLGITNIDPIKYSLLFERFLNPERISMPDIDIDFADRGRDKIIEYVVKKYKEENVCQIITFGTMAARGVIRDVGRVLGVPYSDVDKIAKMVPFAVKMTLEQALVDNPDLKDLYEKDVRVKKLIDLSKTLEGLARHASTHAAGVVIAPSNLTDFIPLFKGSKGEITTQFDMKMTEEIGLLKMDFLGLRTLTVIQDCLKMISENDDKEIDIDAIDLGDKKVYKLFTRGDTVGIFQFESPGMRDYLRKLKPENLTDLTVMNALYRPGPLDSGMIDVYIDRKHGRQKVEFLHPKLEKILKDTYGVIVFQEQVLQIANSLAGYSMGKADFLRKAMGKKVAELMAVQKKEFLDGCDKQKIDPKIASAVFDQIETFARYGFNKAHATGYAYVAYQCAYLKAHYPLEFMAANMTSEMDSSDRIYVLMEECRKMNIVVLPPDVNESEKGFSVSDKKIRFGLWAVKNVGEAAVEAIVEARAEGGPFVSFADFVSRVSLKSLNRRTVESLIAAGAMDTIPGNRAQKTTAVEAMLEFGQKVQTRSNTADLFAGVGEAVVRKEPELPPDPDWSISKKLASEKEMLGFYVSGHPLDRFRSELIAFGTADTERMQAVKDGREVRLGGIISTIKLMNDKRGNRMAFVTLEDFKGTTEMIIFSDCYDKGKEHIFEDNIVMMQGRVSTREGEAPKVIVNDLYPLDSLSERFDCQLVIKLDEDTPERKLTAVETALSKNEGKTPVIFAARRNGDEYFIRSKRFLVAPNQKLLLKLKEILGDSSVYLQPPNK